MCSLVGLDQQQLVKEVKQHALEESSAEIARLTEKIATLEASLAAERGVAAQHSARVAELSGRLDLSRDCSWSAVVSLSPPLKALFIAC